MSLSSHLEELKKKHDSLSAAVEDAQRSPSLSTLEITQLKKQKLRLKEEITRLSMHLRPVFAAVVSAGADWRGRQGPRRR